MYNFVACYYKAIYKILYNIILNEREKNEN